MGKTGHATWFRIYLGQKAFIDGSDDAVVGQALKAALHYFSTGEVQTLDGAAHALFCSFRESVDETLADFEAKSKRNAENVKKRWGKNLPDDTTRTTGNDLLPSDTEEEQEGDERKRRESGEDALDPASKKFLGGQCVYAHDSDAYGLADYFAKEKQIDFPGGAQPTECELQKWAQALQELHDENKVQWEIMDGAMRFALDDEWWGKKVQSVFDFKKNFNKIFAEASCDQRYFPKS